MRGFLATLSKVIRMDKTTKKYAGNRYNVSINRTPYEVEARNILVAVRLAMSKYYSEHKEPTEAYDEIYVARLVKCEECGNEDETTKSGASRLCDSCTVKQKGFNVLVD